METGRGALDSRPPLYVVLVTGTASNGQQAHGTGFIVDGRGHVATCRHVVYPTRDDQPVTNLRVLLPYPARAPYSYQILADSPEDLAILAPTVTLDIPVQQCLDDEPTDDPAPGAPVTVWGYSSAEHYTQAQRFDCVVSGLSGPEGRIGLAGNVNFGDSGGPVIDAQRRLVGIAQAKDAERAGQAMAIPVSLLRALMHKHRLAAPARGGDGARVFQAPALPGYSLVGRERLLASLKRELAEGHHVVLCFRPGVGKSALAAALANDAEIREQFDGVLWANLNLRANVLSELRKWASALGLAAHRIEQLECLATEASDPQEAAQQVVQAWRDALAAEIGTRRMLLVIDDAWDLEPARALLLPAPHCAYLVTTGEPAKVAGMLGPGFDVHVIEDLTLGDAMAFLHQLAPNAVDMFPEKARALFEAVGGLPQGLLLLGMYLRQMSLSNRRRRIEEAYRDIEETLNAKIEPVARAIQVSYDRLPGDDARAALQALSIFRPKPGRFTEEAALAVLRQPASVLDQLQDAGLIENAEEAGDTDAPPYTMHRTIADFASARLDDPRRQELHRRAADHFALWLKHYEQSEDAPGCYGHQYRYENAQWQDTMDDFLYHLARAGDPAAAMAHFGSIYFTAFWWWGCYAEFPFCTRLLQQAASKQLSPEAARSLQLLQAFEGAYPKESLRDTDDGAHEPRGDWGRVEAALTEVRRLGGIDAAPPGPGDAKRDARVFTDIFLAEALRFGRQQFAEAERLYRDALELLPADDWSVPWVHYHLADLFLDTGRLKEAAAHCTTCLALASAPALKDRDNEVIANAWRVRAELAARQGDRAALREGLQRSVLHAYAFQAIPEPPDPYTVAFYQQIARRAAGVVQRLSRDDPAAAQACCQELREYWAGWREMACDDEDVAEHAGLPDAAAADCSHLLAADGPRPLAAWLFPQPPAPEDLHKRGSRYFNEVITVFAGKMRAESVAAG